MKHIFMRKRVFLSAMAVFMALTFLFGMGCDNGSTGSDPDTGPELPSSPRREIVWAGPLGAADWVTIAFKSAYNESVLVYENGIPVVVNGEFVEELVYHAEQAVIQFASETDPHNTAHTEYTYNKNTKAGSIPQPTRASPPVTYAAPGAFTITADEKSIVFADFQGSGNPLTLYKLYPDVGKTFALAPLPADLENTVWAGTGFRSEDWVTLSFRGETGGKDVEVSHVSDSTQWSRTCNPYDPATKNGVVNYIAGAGFEIRDSDTTLRILNFYGHGVPVDLKRVR
ncbi:hypothetical protein AGMMS4952_17130 [Spirochaetia bacterium]|nr:hypothetical protein AGMMS4952_17130 [Spirochaetia bacterium]